MPDLSRTIAALTLVTLAGCAIAPRTGPAARLAGDSGLRVIEITVKGLE